MNKRIAARRSAGRVLGVLVVAACAAGDADNLQDEGPAPRSTGSVEGASGLPPVTDPMILAPVEATREGPADVVNGKALNIPPGALPGVPDVAAIVRGASEGSSQAAGILLAAGDIATCSSPGDEATASLLDANAGFIAALGDLTYPDGSTREFAECFHPSWGRHKSRMYPTPGNHEYHQRGAAPYFAYFGVRAGRPGEGYYSYNIGAWHLIVLNSYSSTSTTSPQMGWLRRDLAANRMKCTLAYFHRPRFSSGRHRSSTSAQRFWQALYDAGADVILSAHDHHYERFAPQTPTGVLDNERGIQQWVVGTGGAGFSELGAVEPNSEVRNNTTHGLLKLTLKPASYDWEFVPIAGGTFTDAGTRTCH